MQHTIVSQDEWLAARKALLAKEKEFTKARDQLSAARRELPWVKVDKTYVFDSPNGKQTLADLFDGRSQLIVYHFMLGPGWKDGCPQLFLWPTISTAIIMHLAQRDVTLVAVSRAPVRRDRGLPETHGLEIQMGVVDTAPTSITISTSRSRQRKWPTRTPSTTYAMAKSRASEAPRHERLHQG